MSTKINTIVENQDFVERLIEICGTDEPAEISRFLSVSYQGAKNYLGGRFPEAKILITIVEKTECSLNWLLTGKGEKFLKKGEIDLKINQENFEDLYNLLVRIFDDIENNSNQDEVKEKFEIIYHEIARRIKMKRVKVKVDLYEESIIVDKPAVK